MRVRQLLLLSGLLTASVDVRIAFADESPWVKGSTPEQRAVAQQLLLAGNTLLLEKNYVAALAKYREAITSWDHPAIRFNIVRCLIQLDRTVEAVDELERALKYGAAPLEENVYTEALAYQKLLANQIASIKLSCTQSGLQISLDGEVVATCPAQLSRRVKPGRHQLVGEKPGYVPRTVAVTVVGGTEEAVSLALDPLSATGRTVHRFSTWIPWVVVGGGVVLAGVGGLVQLAASNDTEAYEREIDRTCSNGCSGPQLAHLRDLESRASFESNLAIGIVTTGVATVIAGSVLLYLNRGRTVYEEPQINVSPTATGGVVTVRGQF